MTAQLPPWPTEKPEHMGLANSAYWEQYERALRIAWEARARKAVEALKRIKFGNCGPLEMSPSELKAVAREALNVIGEMPPE